MIAGAGSGPARGQENLGTVASVGKDRALIAYRGRFTTGRYQMAYGSCTNATTRLA